MITTMKRSDTDSLGEHYQNSAPGGGDRMNPSAPQYFFDKGQGDLYIRNAPGSGESSLSIIEDIEDAAVAKERLAELEEDASTISLADAKKALIAQGLLDG